MQQVLLNILRNGAEAMQEGREKAGNSGIETTNRDPRFVFRLIHEPAPGFVRIEIEDNGSGMDDEIRKRVFEPFFTTKPTGSSTGLGLSVSYFIITENHGGTMNVESRQGQGSKFVIRLPVKA